MVPVPDLMFPEDVSHAVPGFADRLAESFARRPLTPPPNYGGESPLAAFLTHFAAGAGNRIGDQYLSGPRNPVNRLALGRLNLQRARQAQQVSEQDAKNRVIAAKEASKTLNEHKKALAEERKQAEQDPNTPEGQAKIQRDVDMAKAYSDAYQKAGLVPPAKYREPAPKAAPKAPKTPQEIASRRADVKAATDSTFKARGLAKPPHTYVRDKIAQAIAQDVSAPEFERQVRANADKLTAAGFNPDSLIDRGWRSLKRQ